MVSPHIEYAVLPAGDGPGQDRCFTADGLVVVLDGASAYDPSVSPDAGEYVDTLGPVLVNQVTSQPGIDLRSALAEAIRRTAAELALIQGAGPSSTVSIVRWGGGTAEALVLGDSPVVARFLDGTQEVVVQHPMDHIATDLRRKYRERLRAGFGYDDEHKRILAEIQRSEAPLRNSEGGYWIAEASPDAAFAATCTSWPSSTISSIFVSSDGAEPLLRKGKAEALSEGELSTSAIMKSLRELADWEQKDDPQGARAPRSKIHDDKTLAILVPGPS